MEVDFINQGTVREIGTIPSIYKREKLVQGFGYSSPRRAEKSRVNNEATQR